MTAPRDDNRTTRRSKDDDSLGGAPRGARRGRGRYATGGDHRLARPLVIAVVGVVAVAAAIFWPRGGGQHLPLADPVHVVRVDTTIVAPGARSGEVDLTQARQPLVAEPRSHERTTQRDVPLDLKTRVQQEPEPKPATPAAAEPTASPTPAETTAVAPAPPVPTPRPEGPFALQVGSFTSESSAQASRDELATKGYPVHVRAASTATGAIVYRVWVGYFASRDDASAYAAAHADAIGSATPVHR